MEGFGERLRKQRKAKNYSQRQLAECLAVSNQRVSCWERNVQEPSLSYLLFLSKWLDTDPNEMLGFNTFEQDLEG